MRINLGIRAKLSLLVIVTSLVLFGLIFSIIIVRVYHQAYDNTLAEMEMEAQKDANQVKASLNIELGLARGMAANLAPLIDKPNKQRDRERDTLLLNLLENNPRFFAVWAQWKMAAIDNTFIGKTGRTRSVLRYENGKPVFIIDTVDINGIEKETSYHIQEQSLTEEISDPYFYSFYQGGAEYFMASLAVPIIKEGQFSGLTGMDLSLDFFANTLNTDFSLADGQVTLIANNGVIISHMNSTLIGKSYNEALLTKDSSKILQDIKNGKQFYIEARSKAEDKAVVYFVPIKIGSSNHPWSLAVSIPEKVIKAEPNKLLIISLLISIIGYLFLAYFLWRISYRISSPIVSTSKVLNSLSTGNIEDTQKLDILRKDEIGLMARNLNKLLDRFKESTLFAESIGKGNFDYAYKTVGRNDHFGAALVQMRDDLARLNIDISEQDWIKTGVNKLNQIIQGNQDLFEISKNIISFLVKRSDAQVGAIYVKEVKDENTLVLTGSYAFNLRKGLNQRIKKGEGLVGQAAMEKQVISIEDIPDGYFRIQSSFGEAIPKNIVAIPLIYNNIVYGVVELGAVNDFTKKHLDFLDRVSEDIAITINTAQIRTEQDLLLQKTLEQSEELRVQEEELRQANEELEVQTKSLQRSEADLKSQQEELRVTNEELEEKTKNLEEQTAKIQKINDDLKIKQEEIKRKAKELELASKYKSEFLANMSHELRTPLNSLLILSQNLADNRLNNLNKDQIESAQIIYKSGNDLLNMINEILDLSKIESGKMSINIQEIKFEDLMNNMNMQFRHMVTGKGLEFNINIAKDLPQSLYTDQQRIEQIIKNLISNSVKFTHKGSIQVNIEKLTDQYRINREDLSKDNAIVFSVVDTGIGIPKEKQQAIFEAFQQADGSTSRKYGGTGLGLSISRELAKLLGGEIQLMSEEGKGSTFSIIHPIKQEAGEKDFVPEKKSQQTGNIQTVKTEQSKPAPAPEVKKETKKVISNYTSTGKQLVEDDRNKINDNEQLIVVIEDDPQFAKVLYNQCHERNFKCIVAGDGESGIQLINKHMPQAIILDIKLPGMDGWMVLEELKENPKTRHIPVHMMSAYEESIDAYKKGAIGYLTKPIKPDALKNSFLHIEEFIQRDMKNLLIVEDDDNMRRSIKVIISGTDVNIKEVGSGKEALDAIQENEFDCVILDLGLPDMTGFDFLAKLEKIKGNQIPPIIVYTGRELSKEENLKLQNYTSSIIIKGVKSEERLLDESALFLHRVVANLPKKQQKIINQLYNKEGLFQDKKILIADDDMRNIFALTQIFEEKGMQVLKAEDGKRAVELVEENEDIDLVLMDVMMPVMDGLEAIRNIRKDIRFRSLPIISLTAKAMKEDREKCIASGANDYLAKPVDIPKLLSLMRVWLYR